MKSNFRGTIIEESLEDSSILKEFKVLNTKVVSVNEKHKTPWLKQWTLHKVEIPEDKAGEYAERIGRRAILVSYKDRGEVKLIITVVDKSN